VNVHWNDNTTGTTVRMTSDGSATLLVNLDEMIASEIASDPEAQRLLRFLQEM